MIKNYDKAKLLEGTWGKEENWTQFSVRVLKSGITVTACDADDGEAFIVSQVKWDGNSLTFDCLAPSTGWLISHCFTPNRGTTIRECTTFRETLMKRKPTKKCTVPSKARGRASLVP